MCALVWMPVVVIPSTLAPLQCRGGNTSGFPLHYRRGWYITCRLRRYRLASCYMCLRAVMHGVPRLRMQLPRLPHDVCFLSTDNTTSKQFFSHILRRFNYCTASPEVTPAHSRSKPSNQIRHLDYLTEKWFVCSQQRLRCFHVPESAIVAPARQFPERS